jgi:hypothetical protein
VTPWGAAAPTAPPRVDVSYFPPANAQHEVIDRDVLRAPYKQFGKTAKLTNKNFPDLLLAEIFAFHRSEVLADHVNPFEGDIIFFNGAAHLAAATGKSRNVMSLWNQEDSAFEEVTIDFLKGEVGGQCELRYLPCPSNGGRGTFSAPEPVGRNYAFCGSRPNAPPITGLNRKS